MTALKLNGFIFWVLMMTSCNERFVEKTYWPNAEVKAEKIYDSEGDWDDCYLHRGYDSVGTLLEEGEVRNGNKHGLWEFWDENGVLKRTKTYREGRVYGMAYYFDDTGVLSDSIDYGYAGGEIQRKKEDFAESGEGAERFLSASVEELIAEFNHGNDFWLTEFAYYDREERMPKSFKGYFNLGADQDYYWLYWDPEGVLLEKGQYHAGIKEGYWEQRGDSLGRIFVSSRGQYQGGVKIGLWDYTDEHSGAEKDVFHKNGETLLVNFWNGSGKQWVKDGEGMVEGTDAIRIYQDSLLFETLPVRK